MWLESRKYTIMYKIRGLPLFIGGEQYRSHDFQVILNVNDVMYPDKPNTKHYWVPIYEPQTAWGYLPFWTVKKILDKEVIENKKNTLIHCSGGVCRSVIATWFWLGSLEVESNHWERFPSGEDVTDSIEGTVNTNRREGRIPVGLERFMMCAEDYKNSASSFHGILNIFISQQPESVHETLYTTAGTLGRRRE